MNAKRLIQVLQSLVDEKGADVQIYVPRGPDTVYGTLVEVRYKYDIAYLCHNDNLPSWKDCGRHRVYRNEPYVMRSEYEQVAE